MKIKKPLKLLLNWNLWGKLEVIESDNEVSYAFAKVKKDFDYNYLRLYNSRGDIILCEEFEIAGKLKQFLLTISKVCKYDGRNGYYEFNVVDMYAGKVIKTLTIISEFVYHVYQSNKFIIFSIYNDKDYRKIIFDYYGELIEDYATDARILSNDRIAYISISSKTHVLTTFTDEICDVVCEPDDKNNSIIFLGTIRNGEVIFKAMGEKGYAPHDVEFKSYFKEKDGILVRLLDADGNETNDLAFIDYVLGKPTFFCCGRHVTSFKYGKVFVIFRNESDDELYTLLEDYNGNIVAKYKKVLSDFYEIPYGIFSKVLAVVETLDGRTVYVDLDGNEYPMRKKDKDSISDWDYPEFTFRQFKNPMNENME
ncbi:MAG: hypothetical protein MJ246_03450 [Clostridia bacterium]|nr:hypothetical protein [Clostridia bacterium]